MGHLPRWGRTFRFMLLLAAPWIMVGCGQGLFGPEGDEPLLHTDRDRYVARVIQPDGAYTRYGFAAVVRFTNTTPDTLFLGNCEPGGPPEYGIFSLEDDSGEGSAYSPAWACAGHSGQLRIPPGAGRVDTLHIAGPNAWDGLTDRPLGRLGGLMQLVYDVRYCPGSCREMAPEKHTKSNLFWITRGD